MVNSFLDFLHYLVRCPFLQDPTSLSVPCLGLRLGRDLVPLSSLVSTISPHLFPFSPPFSLVSDVPFVSLIPEYQIPHFTDPSGRPLPNGCDPLLIV